MKASRILISTAAAVSVVGVIGFSYAENINYKPVVNTSQTQSDAALPCQPGPFNPHLAKTPGEVDNMVNGTTPDCATFATTIVQVQAPMNTPVVVQTEAALPDQPAPFAPTAQAAPDQTYVTARNDASVMSTELEPRADRN